MSKVIVKVTQDDIDKGQRWMPSSCPLALALTRTFEARAMVLTIQAFIEGYAWADLPESARSFRRNFDSCGKVAPFEFEFEVKPRPNLIGVS